MKVLTDIKKKQVELEEISEKIRESLRIQVTTFNALGFYLKQVRDRQLYFSKGYMNLEEFAAGEFKLSRKLVWAYININDRFSVGGNSEELLPEYKDYSKSLLIEMITLPEEKYPLISKDTTVEEVRVIKSMQDEGEKEVEGQQSLISDYVDIVPEEDKPDKGVTLSEILRELFSMPDMKYFLNWIVLIKDNSTAEQWAEELILKKSENGRKHYLFKKGPSSICFFKNEFIEEISGKGKKHLYGDLPFLVSLAFESEIAQSGDIWENAFGGQRDGEEKDTINDSYEKIAESLDSIPTESDFEEPEKVPETTEIRSEESENELEQPKEESKTPENEHAENAEKPDFTLTETDSEIDDKSEVVEGDVEDKNMSCATCEESPLKSGNGDTCSHCALNPIEDEGMCDIAQFTIILPVLPGDHIYSIYPAELDEEQKPVYATYQTFVYMYEYRSRKTIEMRYYDNKNNSRSCTIPVDGTYQQIMNDNRLFITREEAEERCAELNGES